MIAPLNSEIEKLKNKKPCSCYLETMKNLRGLKENLKSENKVLQERNYNLSFIVSDQNTKIKDLENERMSLVTAIRLLQV